jgi:hypothetical protein
LAQHLIQLNTAAPDEHVPEIERFNRIYMPTKHPHLLLLKKTTSLMMTMMIKAYKIHPFQ